MKPRSLFLAVAVLIAALGVTACSKGSSASQNTVPIATTTAAGSVTVPTGQGMTVATGACKIYDAAVDASNAHPNPAVTYPQYSMAIGEAEGAAKLDPKWTNLAAAFDVIKTDISGISTLQTQIVNQQAQKANIGNLTATLNEDLGLLAGHLAVVDDLCTQLTGSSHPANLTTG
jgi:hypothetical protein